MECSQHHQIADIPARILRLQHEGKVTLGVYLGGKWGGTVINPFTDVSFIEGFFFLHILPRPADQMVLQ